MNDFAWLKDGARAITSGIPFAGIPNLGGQVGGGRWAVNGERWAANGKRRAVGGGPWPIKTAMGGLSGGWWALGARRCALGGGRWAVIGKRDGRRAVIDGRCAVRGGHTW
ncbi:hypothetical protein CYMTET_10734 [Cymbomonas tetramitiformis]|uniref:Uncharacterized protein n=1 Tax=Cymbomonas tetramitiformis TaxID=36881 RepID=A0AAE0LE59_9CHLO|nr:hypothetical protein CYMTET_10734 [Cymbomonas tetramitiformis]